MAEIVVPFTCQLAQLDELRVTPNLFFGAKLHLYKTNIALSPTTVIGDFVECDFSGYAVSSAITWAAASYQQNGAPVIVGDLKTSTAATPTTVPNVVYGYYITDSAGAVLLWARQFATPISITSPHQSVIVLPTYPAFGPAQ